MKPQQLKTILSTSAFILLAMGVANNAVAQWLEQHSGTSRILPGVHFANLVNLKIYGMRGHEVATILNEWRSAGSHAALFDAAGLSSGVYFYRLRAGSFAVTRKLLLMR
jgi:hypothetical protein